MMQQARTQKPRRPSPKVRRARPRPLSQRAEAKNSRRRPAPRKRRAVPASVVAPQRAKSELVYVAEASGVHVNEFEQPLSTDFFNTLGRIQALPQKLESKAIAKTSLAAQRGYETEDLDVIAHMATNYLLNGGLRLAVTLFEGLVAVAPEVSYYSMGLGLTYDRMGELRKAEACYRVAGRLDPKDGRPDVNLAELALSAGDKKRALALFSRGVQKAERRGDRQLVQKARALISHLNRS